MANTKFENATTWLQGVVSGYQKQVNDFSAAPNPDANKIKACKERQELCQYILDFMIKAKQQNDARLLKQLLKIPLQSHRMPHNQFQLIQWQIL